MATWTPDYNPNMAVPSGGFTVGQLLAPNYLAQQTGDPESGFSTSYSGLDLADIPGSFAALGRGDITSAIKDVAPGFKLPQGDIDWAGVLGTQVNPQTEMRQPAPENGFESMLPIALSLALAAATGGAGAPAMLGDAATELGMLGGSAAGSAGAASFAPFAGMSPSMVAGADPIETMIKATEMTGASGWTEAAQKLGWASPEAFLSAINPEWANGAVQIINNLEPGAAATSGADLATTAATGGGTFTWPGLSTNNLALNPNMALTDTLANAASGVVSNPVNIGGFPGVSAAVGGAAEGGITDWWKKLMAQMANDPLKAVTAGGGLLSTALNIGSGILGLNRASQIPRQTEALMARSDPFGPYRAQYAQQLSSLAANPGSVTSMPGYNFARDQGEQALTRKMAQGGYTGSGNEMIALKQFNEKLAGDWYNNEMNRLASLAGAGISPSAIGSIGMTGINAQNDMLSRALASIGYGVRGA